jgi:hypothetical protein
METKSEDSAVPSNFASQSVSPHSWLRHYRANRLNRPEPEWQQPCALPADIRGKLAVSLSHFQLGESGGGRFLLKEAAGNCAADDLEALDLFVKEEAEHARLLARLVQRMGGKLITRHWTHRIFKLARRAGGFHFEIQMLLTAEIVGTAYYEMIDRGVQDAPFNAAIGLMLRDEAGHIAFHLDRLKARWRDCLPVERTVWELQFQVLVLVAMRTAWLDHGRCLRDLGFTWEDFRQNARRATIGFLDGLRSSGCPRRNPSLATA